MHCWAIFDDPLTKHHSKLYFAIINIVINTVQGLFSNSITGGIIQAQASARVLKHFYRHVICKKVAPFGQLSNLWAEKNPFAVIL